MPQYNTAIDPRRGVTTYSDPMNPPNVGQPGGGGCPGYTETLIPDLPFDFLQPPMTKQVTQAGYGGPFVIRSNPIGGLLDTIRNFCFPVPMQQTDTGFSDLSGAGLGSYGDYTSPYLGSIGYQGGSPLGGNSYTPCGGTCGSGQTCDPITNMCMTPTSTANPSSGMMMSPGACDYSQIPAYGAQLVACAGDKTCLCNLAKQASLCAQANAEAGSGGGWTRTAAYINKVAGVNCNDPRYSGAGTSPSGTGASGTTPMAGGKASVATNPNLPPNTPGSMDNPAAPFSGTAGSTPVNSVTNPPATPVNSIQNSAKRLFSFPALPEVVNPMSMTEGNIGMAASREPLGGSYDPGRVYTRYYGRPVQRPQRAPRGFNR